MHQHNAKVFWCELALKKVAKYRTGRPVYTYAFTKKVETFSASLIVTRVNSYTKFGKQLWTFYRRLVLLRVRG